MQIDPAYRVRAERAEPSRRVVRAEDGNAVQSEEVVIRRAPTHVQAVRRFGVHLHGTTGQRLEEVGLRQPGVRANRVVADRPRTDPLETALIIARAARHAAEIDRGLHRLQRYRLGKQGDVDPDRAVGGNEHV